MNVFAQFDEIPPMILQDVKKTKRYRHTVGRSFGCSDDRMDNVKTVYPPTNTVCGGYKKHTKKHLILLLHLSEYVVNGQSNILSLQFADNL